MLVVIVGCSKPGDDCQRLLDKMWPILTDMAKSAGKKDVNIDREKGKFLDECRKGDKMKKDPVMKCVLDASNEDAVKACMSKAFEDYRDKSKATEAKLMLRRLEKAAKRYYAENAAFLKGKTGPTPPAPCCGNPKGKCPALPASTWSGDPVWRELDFQIDEPNLFQYSYESDGQTLKVTAVGDVDCDTKMETYTLTGKVENGNPSFELAEP